MLVYQIIHLFLLGKEFSTLGLQSTQPYITFLEELPKSNTRLTSMKLVCDSSYLALLLHLFFLSPDTDKDLFMAIFLSELCLFFCVYGLESRNSGCNCCQKMTMCWTLFADHRNSCCRTRFILLLPYILHKGLYPNVCFFRANRTLLRFSLFVTRFTVRNVSTRSTHAGFCIFTSYARLFRYFLFKFTA